MNTIPALLPRRDARPHTVKITFYANFSYVEKVYGMTSTDVEKVIKKGWRFRVRIEKYKENVYCITKIDKQVFKSRLPIVKMEAWAFVNTTMGVYPEHFGIEEYQNSF